MPNRFNALADTNFQVILDSLELLHTQTASWRDRAAEWAAAPENVEVDSGKYSAMHYALKAEGSRLAADLAEVAAQAAQLAAETALSDAVMAQAASEAAQQAAELAQGIAESEADAAGIARQGAETAEDYAVQAQVFAEDAQSAAETAEGNAADSADLAEDERGAAEQAAALAMQYRNQAGDFSDIAESYAHYEGVWSTMSGALPKPASVYHAGAFWMALDDIADVAASEPGSANPDWAEIGDSVKSVAGKTGAVDLVVGDVAGLGGALNAITEDVSTKAGRDQVALPVPDLGALMSTDPAQFSKALVSGYYEEGDIEKSIVWQYNPTRSRGEHDGWSCINPGHLSAIGSAGWYESDGDSTDDDGGGVWERKNLKGLTVLDFGAKDEAGYDNTIHFQKSADEVGYVAIPQSENPFEIVRVYTSRKTHFYPSDTRAEIKVLSGGGDRCISLDDSGSGISEGIHIDGNGQSKSAVAIYADHCFAYFSVSNVHAGAGASHAAISGLLVQGADSVRFTVRAENLANTGYSNESTPRVVTVQGTSDNFEGSVFAKNIACGLCLGGNVVHGRIDNLELENASDNGIYQLGSTSKLNVNNFIYRGAEEGIVAGGAETNIESAYIEGVGVACVSLMSGNMKIVNLKVDGRVGASPATIFRARPNSVGRVEVLSLTGSIWGNTMINLAPASSVREFIIRSGDVKFYWTADRAGVSTRWFNCGTANRFHLEEFKCLIIDVNDDMPAGTIFEVRAGAGSGEGSIINPQFYLRQSDEQTPLTGRSLRILRPDRSKYTFVGCSFFTNISSQPAREADYLGPFVANVNRSNNPPTGSWAENTVVYNGLGDNPIGWICRGGSWAAFPYSGSHTYTAKIKGSVSGEYTWQQAYTVLGNVVTINFSAGNFGNAATYEGDMLIELPLTPAVAGRSTPIMVGGGVAAYGIVFIDTSSLSTDAMIRYGDGNGNRNSPVLGTNINGSSTFSATLIYNID